MAKRNNIFRRFCSASLRMVGSIEENSMPNIFISHDRRLVINTEVYPRTYRTLRTLWRMTGGYCVHARVGVNTVDFVQFVR